MADHLDSPGKIVITVDPTHSASVGSPMGDPRTDITDVYAFLKPGDPDKSILVLNVNPLAPLLAKTFNHDAVYKINVDTDDEAVADRSFRITFSEPEDGTQTATARLVRGGGEARRDDDGDGEEIIEDAPVSFGHEPKITTQGPYRFFAGFRSDPFFFDLLGFIDDLNFKFGDFFADKNVFGIVLEVPNRALGEHPGTTSLWGRTLLSKGDDDDLVRDDRMGKAAINTVFNHGVDKDRFNSIDPDQDLTATLKTDPTLTFVQSFRNTLTALGGNPGLATVLLPDVLPYNFSKPSGYLNGRRLQDDVIDISLQLITNNPKATDNVGPHTDYLPEFPYLGTPH
jgi:hypothetical protein